MRDEAVLRKISFYDLSQFVEISGFLFLIRYSNEGERHYEPCRVHTGCKGPMSLNLPAKNIAYCFIGTDDSGSPIVEPVTWTAADDGIKESDAIEFLANHRIPYNISYYYRMSRKPDKYLTLPSRGYLGVKGLFAYNDSQSWYFLSQRHINNSDDPTSFVKSIELYDPEFKTMDFTCLLSVFQKIEQDQIFSIFIGVYADTVYNL